MGVEERLSASALEALADMRKVVPSLDPRGWRWAQEWGHHEYWEIIDESTARGLKVAQRVGGAVNRRFLEKAQDPNISSLQPVRMVNTFEYSVWRRRHEGPVRDGVACVAGLLSHSPIGKLPKVMAESSVTLLDHVAVTEWCIRAVLAQRGRTPKDNYPLTLRLSVNEAVALSADYGLRPGWTKIVSVLMYAHTTLPVVREALDYLREHPGGSLDNAIRVGQWIVSGKRP